MFIIVGLGNKGFEYKNTYHNIGFFVADSLAEKMGVEFKKEKYMLIDSTIIKNVTKKEGFDILLINNSFSIINFKRFCNFF